ncbi:MAG: DUF1553 domain-containing protein [Planctomyces sp.]|nr:DUF1553 domain-containing protein [Planctomyces sp.]
MALIRHIPSLSIRHLLMILPAVWLICGFDKESVGQEANIQVTSSEVKIIPAEVTLTGKEARHRVLLEVFNGSDATGVVSEGWTLKSSAPEIVLIEDETLIPVADGVGSIVAEGPDGKRAVAKITVTGITAPFTWSFRNHVEPILARQGCSSGACHGALAGKGGFRLSLRGYDPDKDFSSIVEQQLGRRVDQTDPGASLLLTKPTLAVPHRGGQRLDVNSLNYRVIAEWIASGSPGPADADPRVERLEVLPEQVLLTDRTPQPLLVRAHYSDGHIEDVTHWAKFTSSNEAVASVTEDGVVNVIGPGEGAVTAWFSSHIVIARLTVPFPHEVSPEQYTLAARRNFIDDLALKQLRRLNLSPAPRSSDDVFIRRVFLDTTGTLPTVAEVRAFLADQSADKRDQLIDRLLERKEFVDYWAYHWSDLLLVNGTSIRPEAVKAYYQWIHGHVAANTPWDQFVRELVTARGSSFEQGATNFYALHQSPEDMAENVSQAFLGLSIGCAKCHNHPLEKWTNDQYYSFANMFSRVRAKGWGGDPRGGDGQRTLVTVSSGELIQPRTGKPQPPAPLDGDSIPFDAPGDRRIHLAAWLTSPSNELFSRSITNRVWKVFFGVGLVEQVDDMRASNPASNEELLAATSRHLVDSKFDLKALIRTILTSETYQRSSETQEQNSADTRYYSHYFPRRLMAEVLLDAVSDVTAVPSEFNQIAFPGADRVKTDFYPAGTRAIQLYDSAVESYFLQTFGRNQRRITCECERSDEPSIVQVLHIANGDTLNRKLEAADNRISKWMATEQQDSLLLDEIFLTCLSRYPVAREQEQLLKVLAETPKEERRALLEDVVWGIVSSREFLFNH